MEPLKHKFSIDKVMSYLSREKLTFLQHEFRRHCRKTNQEGFALAEFIRLILRVIPHKPDDVCDLIYGIYSLFREIDINDDGTMTWDEFVEHIIDTALTQDFDFGPLFQAFQGQMNAENLAKVSQVLQKEGTIPQYLHEYNLLLKAMAQKVPVFSESKVFVDSLTRNTAVVKAIVFKRIDALIIMESNTRKLKVIQMLSNQVICGISSDARRTKILQTIELHLPNEAYILNCALNEKDGMLAVTSTEGLMYFYKYSSQLQRFRVFKIICCCGIEGGQHQIWHLPLFGTFFTAGSKNILREWKVTPKKRKYDPNLICEKCTHLFFPRRGSTSKQLPQSIYETTTNYVERPYNGNTFAEATFGYLQATPEHHFCKDMIQDCIEMYYPYEAYLTAGHDGKINILSKELKRPLGHLDSGHQTGIRQLDYTPYHGAALISVGYEQFFNVWEMEGSTSFGKRKQELPKKLIMVNQPVAAARFLGNTFFVVAVDYANTVKIYNYKTLEVVQSLTKSFIRQQHVTGIMVFGEARFVVLGKKMVYYDTIGGATVIAASDRMHTKKELEIRRMILNERGFSEMEQAARHQQISQILPAIDAIFVESYKTIVVLSKNTLRIYNACNGRMIKIIQGITGDSSADLSCMTLDHNHRKLYCGDSRGIVRVFNVNKGVLMTQLQLSDAAKLAINEHSMQTNKELCALNFFSAPSENEKPNHMLITGQGNSRVSCWDINCTTETDLIRSVSGEAAFKEDILTIASSEHHCLIATGGVKGTICIWDFELFKLDKVLMGSRGGISFLQFANKFPLLISCTQQGVVSVFTIRSAPNDIKNKCIARFVNLNFDPAGLARNAQITSAFLRIKPNPSFEPTHDEGVSSGAVRFFKTEVDEETTEKFETQYSETIREYELSFPSDKRQAQIDTDPALKTNFGTLYNPEKQGIKVSNESHAKLFQRCYPPNNTEKAFVMELVFADAEGNIKWLDLSSFLRVPSQRSLIKYEAQGLSLERMSEPDSLIVPYVSEVKSYEETKVGFIPGRRMFNNAGIGGSTMKDAQQALIFPTILDATKCVLIHIVSSAHKSRINSLRAINTPPYGFITTALDKFVKIWTEEGELCGEINLIKELTNLDKWKFKPNSDQQVSQQLDKIKAIQAEISKLDEKQKEEDLVKQLTDQLDPLINKEMVIKDEYFGLKHQQFRDKLDDHQSLKQLLKAWHVPYKEKKQHVHALFYAPERLKPQEIKRVYSESKSERSDTIQIADQDYNVNKIFPEKVWRQMVDVEEEKQMIKNLSLDYEKFIRQGSIEEIKRNCQIQQSDDPKEKKLLEKMLQRVERQRLLQNKEQHKLSLRMGINLQGAHQAQAGTTKTTDLTKTDKSRTTIYQFSTNESSEKGDKSFPSDVKPDDTYTQILKRKETIKIQIQESERLEKEKEEKAKREERQLMGGVPFTLKQYTDQSMRKIGGQKNTIQLLNQSAEQVKTLFTKSKERHEKAIQNIRGHLDPNYTANQQPTTKEKKVGFSTEQIIENVDQEFQQVIDRCMVQARKLQNILDAKQELEREKLHQYDPDFYNQLTERLSTKQLQEQTHRLLSVQSQLTLPTVAKPQLDQTVFDALKKDKPKFRRKPVVGISSSRNSGFLSKLDRFVDGQKNLTRVKSTQRMVVTADEEDMTPKTLQKQKQTQSQKQLQPYQGDMMLKPGEVQRKLNHAFSQLNSRNYSELPVSASTGVRDGGRQIVRKVVEWKAIQKRKMQFTDTYSSNESDHLSQKGEVDVVRSSFIRKIEKGQKKNVTNLSKIGNKNYF